MTYSIPRGRVPLARTVVAQPGSTDTLPRDFLASRRLEARIAGAIQRAARPRPAPRVTAAALAALLAGGPVLAGEAPPRPAPKPTAERPAPRPAPAPPPPVKREPTRPFR